MKKTVLILGLSAFFAACGSNESSNTSNENVSTGQSTSDSVSSSASAEQEPVAASSKGAQLIAQSDCLSCHKENEKLVGPAYTEVAKKYENDEATVEKLADKIIKGGSGSWGEVPMTPHPTISIDDAKEMSKYILSLK